MVITGEGYRVGLRRKNFELLVLIGFMIIQLASLLALLPQRVAYAAAPTLSDYQTSNWADASNAAEATTSVTWTTGDLVVVVGMTETNSTVLDGPTVSGLSFSLVTTTNMANTTKIYLWQATAASSGSGVISSTASDGSTSQRGLAAFVYSGSSGLGNNNSIVGSSAKTVSLTRSQNNSSVITTMGDWNAVNDTSVTPTPSGGTLRHADFVSGRATAFLLDWGDQGAAGTTSYGITDHTGTVLMNAIAVEVKGNTTVEQEGFRFRADDGSETGATWLAAQDTNISRVADAATRLRMLVNSPDDPASAQYQLEYKKSTDSSYTKVPLTLPAAGSVTYGAAGTYAASSGATSRNPALPTGVTSQSELWAAVGSKNNATHSSSTSGWTKVAQQNSGASWTVSLWRYTGADATSASSITVTWTGSVASFGQSWREQGRRGTDPLGTPSVNSGTTSTHSTTGVTTTSSGSRVMYVDSAAANTVLATPGSWTEDLDNGSATGTTHLTVGGRDLGSSGSSSGNISVTGAAAAWVQWQIELPAPQPAFTMTASSNITASGENTTAQLTPPSGNTASLPSIAPNCVSTECGRRSSLWRQACQRRMPSVLVSRKMIFSIFAKRSARPCTSPTA